MIFIRESVQMRIVFEYIGGCTLSLYSLEDFYTTAKRICEDLFTVTTPEGSIEIRTPDQSQASIKLHIVVQLIGDNYVQYDGAIRKWESIGSGYNWKLVGVLEEGKEVPAPIAARLPLVSYDSPYS